MEGDKSIVQQMHDLIWEKERLHMGLRAILKRYPTPPPIVASYMQLEAAIKDFSKYQEDSLSLGKKNDNG